MGSEQQESSLKWPENRAGADHASQGSIMEGKADQLGGVVKGPAVQLEQVSQATSVKPEVASGA